MERVSWTDVQNFIGRLNRQSDGKFRLPTEAEWEYACREGGKPVRFGFGRDQISTSQANYDGNYTFAGSSKGRYRGRTTPVGSFSANSPGLFDMSGNLGEWTQDWYDKNYYGDSRRKNPVNNNTGSDRVMRGGSWNDYPRYLRCAFRSIGSPSDRDNDIGFRLLRTVNF